MPSYKAITKYFGTSLFDKEFQVFLINIFSDLTEYDILESDYIISARNGVDLGFRNNEAVYDDDENLVFEKGNPIFSHINFYPNSVTLIDNFPFKASFGDHRADIIRKAGT